VQAARASVSAAEKKIQQQQAELQMLTEKLTRKEDELKDSEQRASDYDKGRKELRASLDSLQTTLVGCTCGTTGSRHTYDILHAQQDSSNTAHALFGSATLHMTLMSWRKPKQHCTPLACLFFDFACSKQPNELYHKHE
jgi:small-conductance mechanosensitive channel